MTDDNPSPPGSFYTRTGDDGYTGLLGKGRVPKYDLRPEACGQVDELQAVLGVCRAGPIDGMGPPSVLPRRQTGVVSRSVARCAGAPRRTAGRSPRPLPRTAGSKA